MTEPSLRHDSGRRVAPAEVGPPGRLTGNDIAIAVTFLVAAVALRSPGLGPPSLWLDDAWMALVHRVDDPFVVMRMAVTAPGFGLLLKGVFSVLGFSEVAAQALPFVAGVVAAPGVFLLARRLAVDPWVAALGASMVLLSPVHVAYSTNVKPFTLDLVLALLLTWRAFEVAWEPSNVRLSRLALLGALATFVSGSVAPVALVAVVAPALPGLRRGDLRQLLWPSAYVILLLGWGAALRSQAVPEPLTSYWSAHLSTTPLDPMVLIWDVVVGFVGGQLLGAVVIAVLLAGVVKMTSTQRFLLLGPLVVAAAASFAGVPLGTGRTDIYLYGALALAVAVSLDRWTIRGRTAVIMLVIVLGWMLLPVPRANYADPTGTMQEETRPLVERAGREIGATDQLFTLGSYYAVALYGPWDFTVYSAPRTTQGWWPMIDDQRVVRLPFAPTPEALADSPPVPTGDRVFLLHSHLDVTVFEAAERHIEAGGYVRQDLEITTGARMGIYTRDVQDGAGP